MNTFKRILTAASLSLSFTLAALTLPAAEALAAETDFPAAAPGQSAAGRQEKKTKTVTFLTTIHCRNCVKKVNDNLAFEKGVKDLRISLDDKRITVTFDPAKTDEATLAKAIEKLGYKAEIATAATPED